MASFERVVKYLDLRKASKDTTQNTKPLTLYRGRCIKKLNIAFVVPAFNAPNPGYATLFRQYNYTATKDFYVFDVYGYNPTILVYAMCIKYRVGNTVYRYRLPVTNNSVSIALYEPLLAGAVQAPMYNNEVIKANFCIEFWSSAFPAAIVALAPYYIKTNLIRNPVSASEVSDVIGWSVAETMARADLDVAFPEDLPTPYASGSAWLTN